MFRRSRLQIKTADEVGLMREAGRVVAAALAAAREQVAAGATPRQIDRVAEDVIRSHGAVPSFLGYHGFPASTCISVNDEVVHGIPGDRPLVDGDLVSIDCGAVLNGWHGDAAITVGVGELDAAAAALSEATRLSLAAGIEAIRVGGRLSDIGAAIEASIDGRYGIVDGYVGHGIGTAMHMPPDVHNVGPAGHGPEMVPGLVLAIEPMVTLGTTLTRTLDDDWTVVTADGSLAAHWEHTVAVTEDGPRILTVI